MLIPASSSTSTLCRVDETIGGEPVPELLSMSSEPSSPMSSEPSLGGGGDSGSAVKPYHVLRASIDRYTGTGTSTGTGTGTGTGKGTDTGTGNLARVAPLALEYDTPKNSGFIDPKLNSGFSASGISSSSELITISSSSVNTWYGGGVMFIAIAASKTKIQEEATGRSKKKLRCTNGRDLSDIPFDFQVMKQHLPRNYAPSLCLSDAPLSDAPLTALWSALCAPRALVFSF